MSPSVLLLRRHASLLVRYAAAATWTLLAFCVFNYLLVRVCVSDMNWHAQQRDQTRLVVGRGGFAVLPRFPCPRLLVIVVCSAVGHFEQRAAMRDTWARDAAARKSRTFFLIGLPDDTPSGRVLQERVANESARYSDIIQAAFRDSYRNLTLKSVFLLKWAYMHCSSTRFVMKTDDDVFVNVNNLLRFLRTQSGSERRTRPFLVGNIFRGQGTARELVHRNYLPRWVFPSDKLPPYVSGTAYVMSRDAVRPLFTEALVTPFLYVEDLFVTGVVAHKVGVEKIDSRCFVCCWNVTDPCHYRVLFTAHRMEPAALLSVWRHVRNDSAICGPSSEDKACPR